MLSNMLEDRQLTKQVGEGRNKTVSKSIESVRDKTLFARQLCGVNKFGGLPISIYMVLAPTEATIIEFATITMLE